MGSARLWARVYSHAFALCWPHLRWRRPAWRTLPEPELPLIHLDSPYNREGQLPRPASPPAFPLRSRTADEHVPLMKRAMDITGSLIALVLLSPLLLVIALTIKLTSKGPVFFRQKRVGQYGKQFVFLKFRSMCVNNSITMPACTKNMSSN